MFPGLRFGPLLEDLIPLASAVYSEVEQTCCDVPLIDSSNNLICLYQSIISPLR